MVDFVFDSLVTKHFQSHPHIQWINKTKWQCMHTQNFHFHSTIKCFHIWKKLKENVFLLVIIPNSTYHLSKFTNFYSLYSKISLSNSANFPLWAFPLNISAKGSHHYLSRLEWKRTPAFFSTYSIGTWNSFRWWEYPIGLLGTTKDPVTSWSFFLAMITLYRCEGTDTSFSPMTCKYRNYFWVWDLLEWTTTAQLGRYV